MEGMDSLFENSKFETNELELVNNAMENAYNILTGSDTFESLFEEDANRVALPFNPYSENVNFTEVIDTLIEHYTEMEWYERCAILVKLKKNGR